MNKVLRAYKLNDSDMIVTQKSLIFNVKDSDFTEVSLIISIDEIKEWAKEIMDEEDL